MTTSTSRIQVWDAGVRLFHWLIVLIIPLMWWTAEEGHMDWHRRLGITMLGLVIFRLIWGFAGAWTARFIPMLKRLMTLPSYLTSLRANGHKPSFGHSPLGTLSVFALIVSLCVQVGTGLFTVDVDGLESGPLAIHISFETGRQFADIHELNFDILSTFITLHVIAILVYRFYLKDRLIGPMLGGKRSATEIDDIRITQNNASVGKFLVSALAAVAIVFGILSFG